MDFPAGSTILFAQLMWTRTSAVDPNSAITFTTPTQSVAVAPTLSDVGAGNRQWRAADVSAIVQASGPGTYACSNFPTTVAPNSSNIITTNWGLLVVYRNDALPFRYFNVNTGAQDVSSSSQANFTFTGFFK